ncbi:MAG TPA: ATP-binding protein, partial [Polyangiaceae bacterium]|nr:ATP-binding protein [Polyangiaceae bacterium]
AELIGEIDEATHRASELVRKLLASPGRAQRAPRPIDLNGVVVGLSAILKRLAGSGIELVIDAKIEGATVLADPMELEQVLLNLAVNARDAMPRGGRLSIETARIPPLDAGTDPRQGYVALIVSDEGVGMDATTASRIFEPFFTTKGSAGGTGLGLAGVKRIIDQSGGRIRVETQPGRGARFEVLLPRAVETEDVRRDGEIRPA